MCGNATDLFDSGGDLCDGICLDASQWLDGKFDDDEHYDDGGNDER